MASKLFRKVALERLSSPEQLDEMVRVTRPVGWIALLALGALLGAGLIWGIYGRIPTKIAGQGILIHRGGIVNIVSEVSGRVSAMAVKAGEMVEKGQTVARVSQDEILTHINQMKDQLSELQKKSGRIERIGTENIELQSESLSMKRANIIRSIEFDRERLKWLKERLENQKTLIEQGLITKSRLIDTQQMINDTRRNIREAENRLKQVSVEEFHLTEDKEQKVSDIDQELRQAKRKLREFEDDYAEKTRIISAHSGRVLEIAVNEGKLIGQGQTILNIEVIGEESRNMEAVIYVSPTEGKKIRPGMRVQVAPSTVKQEEHGFIIGLVTYVSEFPATEKGMMLVLQNEALVRTLSQGVAPIEVYAELIPNPLTASGYKWSSSDGPPVKVQSGTICSVTVIADEQPPITLVLPWLKKNVLGIGQD